MARSAVDISILGDKELERQLARLETGAAQKKAIRPALRKAARRQIPKILIRVSGAPVAVITGELRDAVASMKVKALPRSRSHIGAAVELPEGKDIRIKMLSVEYGHGGPYPAPPYPYMRAAVDAGREREFALIGEDIGKAITKQAMRR